MISTSNQKSVEVIFEDNHLIAVNKKVSQLVEGNSSDDITLEELIKSYLKEKYNKQGNVFLGVVHRIDRPVSGVVLFSKTGKALTRMNFMFQNFEIEKRYWAVVQNLPPKESDTLVHYLVRNHSQNKSYSHDNEVPDKKKGILKYQCHGKSNKYYFLEIELVTGRHHQIRSQLSKIGCPIKGDLKYGFDRSNTDGGIHLHSRSMSFVHPVKKEKIIIKANPPDEVLWNEFKRQMKNNECI